MITQTGVYRRERDQSFWQVRANARGTHEKIRPLELSLDKTRLVPKGPWKTPSVAQAGELVWYGPLEIMGSPAAELAKKFVTPP